ncbi:Beta-hexosaminidase subunit alpha [Hypsibius exemplaris]|uniref:Beta-hexosaminidase n=1 Tax=Hypsibius exemplaris TaxID=2072580 RepID=A0A1W0WM22_HYPEX|nr:Beta-hexosaminidase subunit alpha [Hypsibius exemplaris]
MHPLVWLAIFSVVWGAVIPFSSAKHPRSGNPPSSWGDIQKQRRLSRAGLTNDGTAALWPLPQQSNFKSKLLLIEDFRFTVKGPSCSILDAAIQRYYGIIFGKDWRQVVEKSENNATDRRIPALSRLYVTLNPQNPCSDTDYPDVDMDEHYEIIINDPTFSSVLVGNTVWGAVRGLETFSQLIWRLDDGRLVINQSMVVDWPRFSHRGLMLDTSRHFISKRIILQNLDAMAMNKYNVFHWHIVDDQSFPYQSRTFPDLSTLDIAEVIEYARVRGIRVIAEFDTPGHATSWGYALSKLLTPCYTNGSADGSFGPINPILNSTYDTLTDFFTEILEVFPDRYLHLGGDEVDFTCWQSNPAITAFMKKKGFGKDYAQLEEYYVQTLIDLLDKIPSTPRKGKAKADKHEYIVWQEVFDNNVQLDNDTIVHVWKDWKGVEWQKEIANVTKAGYRSILSSCWYLNYISYGADWTAYYNCDPQQFNGSAAQKELVIGGETCMWGEYIDDTNVLVKLWPRASAVAERLWSDQTVTDTNLAGKRLRRHRCLMDRRGIPAEPNLGPDFCQPEYSSSK